MNTKVALALSLLVTVGVTIYSAMVYPTLPDTIPTHWNIHGKVDQMSPKGWTVFLMPIVMVFMTAFLFALPWLSPKNFKIDTFRSTFNYIVFLVTAMMGYLAVVILLNTMHPKWDSIKFMMGGIMLFLGLLGNMLGKVQRNFYVGIRTPWTLASEQVWVATHRVGAWFMTAGGFGGLILVLVGVPVMIAFWVFIAACLFPVPYSLVLYKKLEASGRLNGGNA